MVLREHTHFYVLSAESCWVIDFYVPTVVSLRRHGVEIREAEECLDEGKSRVPVMTRDRENFESWM